MHCEAAVQKFEQAVEEAKAEGGTVECGGKVCGAWGGRAMTGRRLLGEGRLRGGRCTLEKTVRKRGGEGVFEERLLGGGGRLGKTVNG